MKCTVERTIVLTMTIEESRALYKALGGLGIEISKAIGLSGKQGKILDAMADAIQIITCNS